MKKKILIPIAIAYVLFTILLLLNNGSDVLVADNRVDRETVASRGEIVAKEDSSTEASESKQEADSTAALIESSQEPATEETTEEATEEVSDNDVGEKKYYDVPVFNDNRKNVMIRKAPDIKAKIIGKIRVGDTAEAMHLEKDEREWTIVSYNGIVGYSNLPVLAVRWEEAEPSKYTDVDLTEAENRIKQ